MINRTFFAVAVTVFGFYNVSDASAQLFRRDQPTRGQQHSQEARQAPPRDGRVLVAVLGAAVEGYAEYEHQKSRRQQTERDHQHRVQMDRQMLEAQNRQQSFENDLARRRERQDADRRQTQQNAAAQDRQRQMANADRQRKANERAQTGAGFGRIVAGEQGARIGEAVGNDVIREGINARKQVNKALGRIRF